MKQVSRSVLKKLNVDWRYHLLKRTGFSFYTKETSGKILEFVGTSGLGKTTLFRECASKLRRRWFFSCHLEFFNEKPPSRESDEYLMQILQNRISRIYESEYFCPWHSLLDLKLSVKVMHETMLVAQRVMPKGFIFDEGLFRHFPAEILEMGENFPVELWENRAFIYLRAQTPETALWRRRVRELSPAGIKEGQRVRTDNQMLSVIVQEQKMFQSIVDQALLFGCPVLIVDAESPLQDSVKMVLDFEKLFGRSCNVQEETETGNQVVSTNR